MKLFELFESNPASIAISLLVERLWRRLVSAPMAFWLKAPGLRLGPGCRVIGGRHIVFGQNIYANSNLWLEAVTSYHAQRFTPSVKIGNQVRFSDAVHISAIERIEIGNHVLMGSCIYISDHNHGSYKGERQSHPEQPPAQRGLCGTGGVTVGDNVWIGDNSVIIGPVFIGHGAIVAANSVVRGVVPPNSIVAGAPAKVVKVFNAETGCWERR